MIKLLKNANVYAPEKLGKKEAAGLVLLTAGTVAMALL